MREMTATDAKVNFGELLSLLPEGPVAITRNGRRVATVIASPEERPRADPRPVRELLALYSNGQIGRQDLEEETRLSFGEIVLAMRELALPLPRVRTYDRLSPAQKAAFDEIFSP